MSSTTTTHLGKAALGALLLAAAGCGSTADRPLDAGAGAADAAASMVVACGDPNAPIDPTAALDDMEDDNFLILAIGGRNGAWWAGGDTTGGQIVPDGDAPPEMIPGGRCGSKYAMRVTGQGFTDWGSLLSMSFKYGSVDGSAPGLLPYDAHIREGITF